MDLARFDPSECPGYSRVVQVDKVLKALSEVLMNASQQGLVTHS